MVRRLKEKWPRSKDNLYSPSVEAVAAAISEQQQRLAISLFQENRAELNRRRDSHDHMHAKRQNKERSLIRWHKREDRHRQVQQSERKKLALSNAKLYYSFLREQVQRYTKADVLLYVKHSALQLKERHHREYRLFLLKLQRERHHTTSLYEDYYMPFYHSHRHLTQWLPYENAQRRLLMTKLRQRQGRAWRLFLCKQRAERFLNFFTCMKFLVLYQKEQLQWLRINSRNNAKPFFYL